VRAAHTPSAQYSLDWSRIPHAGALTGELVANDRVAEYEEHIRGLLTAIRTGDRAAFDALIETVGHEMRKLSAFHLRQRAPSQTLQTTALVHEAVLRMIQMLNTKRQKFPETKEHLMALVSQMMRYTLTDYARKRKLKLVSLDEPGPSDDRPSSAADDAALQNWSESDLDDLLAVDEAITALERSDPEYGKRRSAAIELYLFGGMNYREIAEELAVTDDMARRDCQIALSRLKGLLGTQRRTGSSSST
jgi:RNA polymerase sigma factor (TIGR02999 family)